MLRLQKTNERFYYNRQEVNARAVGKLEIEWVKETANFHEELEENIESLMDKKAGANAYYHLGTKVETYDGMEHCRSKVSLYYIKR